MLATDEGQIHCDVVYERKCQRTSETISGKLTVINEVSSCAEIASYINIVMRGIIVNLIRIDQFIIFH